MQRRLEGASEREKGLSLSPDGLGEVKVREPYHLRIQL